MGRFSRLFESSWSVALRLQFVVLWWGFHPTPPLTLLRPPSSLSTHWRSQPWKPLVTWELVSVSRARSLAPSPFQLPPLESRTGQEHVVHFTVLCSVSSSSFGPFRAVSVYEKDVKTKLATTKQTI